jgi:hypothetical protein
MVTHAELTEAAREEATDEALLLKDELIRFLSQVSMEKVGNETYEAATPDAELLAEEAALEAEDEAEEAAELRNNASINPLQES